MSDRGKQLTSWRHWVLWGFAVVQSGVLLLGLEHNIRTESAYSGVLALASWGLLVVVAQVLSGYSEQLFSPLLGRAPVLRDLGAVRLCLWLPLAQIVAAVLMVTVLVAGWPQAYDLGYLALDETPIPLAILLLLVLAAMFELCGLLLTWLLVGPLRVLPAALRRAVRNQGVAIARFGPLLGLLLILGILPLTGGASFGLDESVLRPGGGSGSDEADVFARILALAGWPVADLGLEVANTVWLFIGRAGLAMVAIPLFTLLGLGLTAKLRDEDPNQEWHAAHPPPGRKGKKPRGKASTGRG